MRRNLSSRDDQVTLVVDRPLDRLTFGEVHRLGDRGREVNVILGRRFTLDALNFGWIAHENNLVI